MAIIPTNPLTLNMPGTASRGGGWVLAQSILLTGVVALGVITTRRTPDPIPLSAGIFLMAIAGVLGVAGVRHLGLNRTPFPTPRPGSALVQCGIYARIRHPLYLSVILGSIGWALAWRSGWALGLALLEIPFFRAKSRVEESNLARMFPDYPDYAARVPGFFPRLRR